MAEAKQRGPREKKKERQRGETRERKATGKEVVCRFVSEFWTTRPERRGTSSLVSAKPGTNPNRVRVQLEARLLDRQGRKGPELKRTERRGTTRAQNEATA